MVLATSVPGVTFFSGEIDVKLRPRTHFEVALEVNEVFIDRHITPAMVDRVGKGWHG
jgi:hypothetical protein